MEGHAAFLAKIVTLLNGAGIQHMLCGSVASMAYSGPRNTNDVDIVIRATLQQLNAFLSTIDDDLYYISPEAAHEAFKAQSMFNLIDFNSGWKVDLIFLKSREFEVEEFERRVPGNVWGVESPPFHGRASRTRLKGVCVARRNRVNPPSSATFLMVDSPACAPSAGP